MSNSWNPRNLQNQWNHAPLKCMIQKLSDHGLTLIGYRLMQEYNNIALPIGRLLPTTHAVSFVFHKFGGFCEFDMPLGS